MEFKPERWVDPHSRDTKEASQPFLVCPRACIGRKWAFFSPRLLFNSRCLSFTWWMSGLTSHAVLQTWRWTCFWLKCYGRMTWGSWTKRSIGLKTGKFMCYSGSRSCWYGSTSGLICREWSIKALVAWCSQHHNALLWRLSALVELAISVSVGRA